MFAGDTSLLFTANTQDDLIQKFDSVFNHALKWFQANRLFFNPTNTKDLQFRLSKLPTCIQFKICWSNTSGG